MEPTDNKTRLKTIIDREKLNQLKTCPACGRPFNLGEPVVLACGSWEGPAQLIHENEAVYDQEAEAWVEKKSFATGTKGYCCA